MMSAHSQCGPAAPWPSSWRASTHTWSASWAGGLETRCCATSTRPLKPSQQVLRRVLSNMGTMRLSLLPTGAKTPATRLWASPWPFMGYNGMPGIGLVRIRQINSPYYTNISKYIPSSSVNTLTPLAEKVAQGTKICSERGGPTRTRSISHMRDLPRPEALGTDIE